MGPKFFGRYEHSLDTKGRVILPARFRSQFDSVAFLTQHLEGCLALWTPDEFQKRMEYYAERQDRGAVDRNLARVFAAGTVEVEIDKQGRLPLPGFLQEYAHLERTVLVMGAIERIELWDPGHWDTRVRPAESSLTDPADPITESGA